MQLLNLTLPSTAGNLALDEWLLTRSDAADQPRRLLRLWENPRPAVILGRSSRYDSEINEPACRDRGMDICRRASGGASVVIGPGCLMYSLILDYRLQPALRRLDEVHGFVMARMARALGQCGVQAEFQGTCDLTVGGRKFSGNSLRCQRNCLLYHGTLLYNFPLQLLSDCLRSPPRQPEYRGGRSHRDFVTNLPVTAAQLKTAVAAVWQADPETQRPDIDLAQVDELAQTRYLDEAWTRKRT